jgi:broad specificity phosphatase PhoE
MGAIYLIRHGQASFGSADYDALSKTGHEQARVLGASLKTRLPTVDAVLSGSMRRHRETAANCLEAMSLSMTPREDTGFNEYDHVELVNRYKPAYVDRAVMWAEFGATVDPKRAFQAMFAKAIDRWMAGGHDADYTESWPVFRERTTAAFDALVAGLGASKTALVFTSGGVISALAQRSLGIPNASVFAINWTLANCGITKFICGARGVYLSTLNEHAHFEGAQSALISYR